ncbi:aminotransferase-like domain-containing protein [Rhodococcus tibetensis]|uniref:PLP-dependent aminotransferase family protein n=1 Tax=Rhodococcus tibetensis TaxID=2965064 RepID=A0ABT1QDH6_9NOCA|nr:PLP-dependent aminotransferase family protein [Rhodococcus sp. FXJ9.536]MCQ4120318.1 PLP-dependent aminotransferase family protein [Rhodococcus sp. FXJ9.536]
MPHTFSRRMDGLRSSAIRNLLALTARPDVISLAGGLPDPDFIPRERIRKEAERALTDPASVQYGETTGLRRLRDVLAAREGARIGRLLNAGEVVVTHGSQQALSLLAQVLLDPGDVVVVEEPAYTGALQVFRAAQAAVQSVPLDRGGMNTAALQELLESGVRPTVVHTVSNFHNPRGVVLAADRRKHLAALADRYGFWVIEDDPYGELFFDAPAPRPVAAFSDRVIRLSSASKILAPALRVGWLHGDRRVCEAVELLKQGADLCGSSLTHQITAAMLSDEAWLALHLDMLRTRYGARSRALTAGISSAFGDSAALSDVQGGMFCWVEFTDDTIDTAALLRTAVEHGVAFVPGSAFGMGAHLGAALRLCYATCPEDVLAVACERLGDAYLAHAQS